MAVGESRSCVCTRTGGIGVWGNGRYSPSSSVCEAALHAGVITRSGGETNVYAAFSSVFDAAQHAGAVDFRESTVTVFVGGSCDRFFGTKRFGIGSESRSRPARLIAFQQPFLACQRGPW